jgi:hypothetical protein
VPGWRENKLREYYDYRVLRESNLPVYLHDIVLSETISILIGWISNMYTCDGALANLRMITEKNSKSKT